ncbi:CBS domain-containing protein [Myxococcus xanthus]|uniref:CBS domain-containing protein n=1 Tax=Myxococcus xanthus TaxID=34 RepID=A0A7Y4MT16_MYXXA|nr:CBS domain-containing protein [Myxococcus xanthus]NOJ80128.1 CBS domain-containing protein [Myxococcus xanthus]NOJ87284.1 CBS domain-containing protein [Myxococcus xanthus]
MAHRSMDNGRDETHREADVAPPGSRERAESDLTGWNPARDEESSTRQGRYYRAATMRMALPRTQVDDGPREDVYGTPPEDSGPYGRDDRDSRYATGWGPRHDTGEQDVELSRQRADYRPWDRSGYGGGGGEPSRTQPPQGEPYRDVRFHGRERGAHGEERHGDARPRYRMDRSTSPGAGRDEASTHRGEGAASAWARDEASTQRRAGTGAPSLTGARRDGASTQVYTAVAGHSEASTSRRDGRARTGRWHHEALLAREVMTRNVRTARPESPLRDIARIMKDESCGVVPIVDERGRLVGIVTDRDLVVRAFTGGRSPEQLRASDVMTDDVEAVTPDDTLHDVIGLMGRRQLRRIPVVERDDSIVGIISLGDIALRADHDEELQQALERISSKRSFWSQLG